MTDKIIEHLNAARRLLVAYHDIVDIGAPDEHPDQGPNWAMQATDAIDEAISHVALEGGTLTEFAARIGLVANCIKAADDGVES